MPHTTTSNSVAKRTPLGPWATFAGSTSRGRGFTLLELTVTVVVLGVLAAIAIPVFLNQRNKAHDAAAISAVRNMATVGRANAVVDDNDHTVFPGPDTAALISALRDDEPEYEISASPDLSDGPNHVWVWRVEEVDTVAVYAALSGSGRCWYVYDFIVDYPSLGYAAGTHLLYEENPPGDPAQCGRQVPLEDIPDELTPEDVPDALPVPEAPPTPDELVIACGEYCHHGSVWGDPHLVTFDGLGYEFQTVGEYVFFRSQGSLDGALPVEAHLRTGNPVAFPDVPEGREFSYATGIAVRVGDGSGETLVSIDVDSDLETPDDDMVRVDGSVVQLQVGEVFTFADGQVGGEDFSQGYVHRHTGAGYTITWPDLEEVDPAYSSIVVSTSNRHMNVYPHLSGAYTAGVEGLLGNADGDSSTGVGDSASGPYDDLMTGTGVNDYLTLPISNHEIHTSFADSWAVDEVDSLFVANGLPHTVRDDGFPARYVDNENPVSAFANIDPLEVANALEVCETAGVHAFLQAACAFDVIHFGAFREEEALRGALNAAHPILINNFDDWDELLTFPEDYVMPGGLWAGGTPTWTTWQNLHTHSGDASAGAVVDGAFCVTSQGEDHHPRRVTRYNVVPVGEDFTFQADVWVPGHATGGHVSSQYGLLISDGTTMYKVRFGPSWIADGNDLDNPEKTFVTNLESRYAQIRIIKTDAGATLYIDGQEFTTLTPADSSTDIANFDFNQVSFGKLAADASNGLGVGRACFDNVGYSTEPPHGELNMSIWGPNPWAHTLHFNDDALPTAHGWIHEVSRSSLGHSPSVSGGKFYLNGSTDDDSGAWFYTLKHTVSEQFTLQADIQVYGLTTLGHNVRTYGMAISDTNNIFQIRVGPTHIQDGNDLANPAARYNTNLISRAAQVRIVKDGATASLFVDGVYAFDLAAVEAPSAPASGYLGANMVAIGALDITRPQGGVSFDNVRLAGEAFTLGDVPMDGYSLNTWIQNLDFDTAPLPALSGWVPLVPNSLTLTEGLTGGVLQLNDASNSGAASYTMPYGVPSEFTFEIGARVVSGVNPNLGIAIADGTHRYELSLAADHVRDKTSGTIYPVDLQSRHGQIRITKSGESVNVWVDGVNRGVLQGAASTENYVRFGSLANAGTSILHVDQLRMGLVNLGGFEMTAYNYQWLQDLAFENSLLPHEGEQGWIRYGKFSDNKMSIVAGPDGNRVRISDPGSNNAAAYRREGMVGVPYRFQADVQVESQSGGDDLAIAIDDGSARVRVNLYTDKITDPVSGATHNVDLTEVHTITVTKTALGGSVAIDGSTVLSLDPAASISNSVHFGSLDTQQVPPYNAGNNTAAVAFFDNVRITDKLD